MRVEQIKTFVPVLVVAVTLFIGNSFAGSGRLENGRFNLSTSIRFNAPSATLNALRDRFQQASELLFDATDGQHQFGTIRVCNNSRGGRNADIWIPRNGSPDGCSNTRDDDGDCPGDTNSDGVVCRGSDLGVDEENADMIDNDGDGRTDEDNACARSFVSLNCVDNPGLGRAGCQITLFEDNALQPRSGDADGRNTVAHEFAHYAYGVFDEYSGPTVGEDAVCLVPPFIAASPASLMENYWLRNINEFCVAGNHDTDDPTTPRNEANDTFQSSIRGESSWETMASFFPDLTIPAGVPIDNPPAGAAAINWTVLEPETRLVLVIDRSGSMDNPPAKLRNAKGGARLFADLVSVGDRLGVVSFAGTVTSDFPLTRIGNMTRDDAKRAIDGIAVGGVTNIGGGLRTALNQILAAGGPACQQIIILLTDGMHNTGEDPNAVLPDIMNAGVIVHTIGIGADADNALLTNIAMQTNGRFFAVPSEAGMELPGAFSTLFADSTENGGTITSALSPAMPGELRDQTVTIDRLTPEVTFLISWPVVADFDLTLVSPAGIVITPDTAAADPNVTFESGTNHEFYTVLSPQVGRWTMRIQAVNVPGQVDVTAQALGISDDISFTATPNEESFVFPEPVLVQAIPMAPINVVGATVKGTITRPDGSFVPITLFDDGLESHGDVRADDGDYTNFFSAYNEDGTYSFEIVATASNGFLFTGEGLFAFPELGFIPPEGASNVRAPRFRRTAGFAVTVSGVPAGCQDADGDGFLDAACGGNDCDDTNPAVSPGAREVCTGGIDEDCDARIDCGDPDCAGDSACRLPLACAGLSPTIFGTPDDDILRGTSRLDIIHGRRGNDAIRGLRGSDTICGGRGSDRLLGQRGSDRLFGQRGRDSLFGQQGNDALNGGRGPDLCNGGPGRNTAVRCERVVNVP